MWLKCKFVIKSVWLGSTSFPGALEGRIKPFVVSVIAFWLFLNKLLYLELHTNLVPLILLQYLVCILCKYALFLYTWSRWPMTKSSNIIKHTAWNTVSHISNTLHFHSQCDKWYFFFFFLLFDQTAKRLNLIIYLQSKNWMPLRCKSMIMWHQVCLLFVKSIFSK